MCVSVNNRGVVRTDWLSCLYVLYLGNSECSVSDVTGVTLDTVLGTLSVLGRECELRDKSQESSASFHLYEDFQVKLSPATIFLIRKTEVIAAALHSQARPPKSLQNIASPSLSHLLSPMSAPAVDSLKLI